MNTFADSNLNEEILKAIEQLGFVTPTPIQAQSIPHILSSKQDLIAFAQTGTGKTAAFGLPAVQLAKVKNKKTQTLILCPTRELCLQITKDIENYSKFVKGFNVVAVYGGASIDTQMRQISKGAHIVVGTPGRTNDLIRRGKLDIGSIDRIVLDEADEMLNMGFKEELDTILAETPEDKQTLLFSATMPKGIVSITKKFMRDPFEISVAQKNTANANVKHVYYMVQAKDRYEVLKRIADINPNIYGIVFCRTRNETRDVATRFMGDGYNADALHGDLSQAQRDEVMNRFRNGQLQLLIATDVAARGLDVTELTHVINYNLPDDPEVYVHRSGRTGRAGNKGTSIAIIHTRESRRIADIEKMSKISFTKELVPNGKEVCEAQLYSLIDTIKKVEINHTQIDPFLEIIYEKLASLSREELIQHFVSAEFNRFLAYYKNARDINVSDNGSSNKRDKKNKTEKRSDTDFASVRINVGRSKRINPAQLMGLINEALNSNSAEVGKIEITDTATIFEVDKKIRPQLVQVLGEYFYADEQVIAEATDDAPAESAGRRSPRMGGGSGGPRGGRGGGDRNRGGSGDRKPRSGGDRKPRSSAPSSGGDRKPRSGGQSSGGKPRGDKPASSRPQSNRPKPGGAPKGK